MQFKQAEQSDRDRLEDLVVGAMETGNPGRAREVLAEHADTYALECAAIRTLVLRDYGIRL